MSRPSSAYNPGIWLLFLGCRRFQEGVDLVFGEPGAPARYWLARLEEPLPDIAVISGSGYVQKPLHIGSGQEAEFACHGMAHTTELSRGFAVPQVIQTGPIGNRCETAGVCSRAIPSSASPEFRDSDQPRDG